MSLADGIYRLRQAAKLTQEEFGEKMGVTHQSVQKWESGESIPSLEKVIRLARLFHVSVDRLLFDSNLRVEEELPGNRTLFPSFESLHPWELYSEQLDIEYRQSSEEGLVLSEYADLFRCVGKLRRGPYKTALADVLFDLVRNARTAENYAYREPSDYPSILQERPKQPPVFSKVQKKDFRKKVEGAWYGRICGCLLGKPIEGIKTDEFHSFLKETGNFPLQRYLLSSDLTPERTEKYQYPLANRCYADTVECAPSDDDTNYTVLYQKLIEEYGRNFTSADISKVWLARQPKNAYCTAERVAFCNFVKGYLPPDSAVYQNPYREWIGAQIRADYFGYINPGNPEAAAEMAWRDGCVSHVKNGIYGEMFVAAMLACAPVCPDLPSIIRGGLGQIPARSRLAEGINRILTDFEQGMDSDVCFRKIHFRWDEKNEYDWCHTVSNAEIVTAALLYGGNDFGRSVCLAVQCGFDTDCNGATVGSVLGMKNGIGAIGPEWIGPVNGKLKTSVFGVETVGIEDLVARTLEHTVFPD